MTTENSTESKEFESPNWHRFIKQLTEFYTQFLTTINYQNYE
jgi:hypothetical protein